MSFTLCDLNLLSSLLSTMIPMELRSFALTQPGASGWITSRTSRYRP